MKLAKKDIKIAKYIFLSNIADGELDEAKISSWIKKIKNLSPRKSIGLLKSLLAFVSSFYRQKTIFTQSSKVIDEKSLIKIREIFEKRESKSLEIEFRENPSLVGGLKVKLGDNVWDYSINQTLSAFKEIARG
ncbi:MAG: F0F1 ATP synthase subunit delta [Candidatus Woykebacteria bacterium]